MIDITLASIRTYHESRNADAVAVFVDLGRRDVIVKSAPIVPRQENRGAIPVRTLHDRVDDARHVCLTGADERRRVFAIRLRRAEPYHAGQLAALGIGIKVA